MTAPEQKLKIALNRLIPYLILRYWASSASQPKASRDSRSLTGASFLGQTIRAGQHFKQTRLGPSASSLYPISRSLHVAYHSKAPERGLKIPVPDVLPREGVAPRVHHPHVVPWLGHTHPTMGIKPPSLPTAYDEEDANLRTASSLPLPALN